VTIDEEMISVATGIWTEETETGRGVAGRKARGEGETTADNSSDPSVLPGIFRSVACNRFSIWHMASDTCHSLGFVHIGCLNIALFISYITSECTEIEKQSVKKGSHMYRPSTSNPVIPLPLSLDQ
jgi:hypothetical protein